MCLPKPCNNSDAIAQTGAPHPPPPSVSAALKTQHHRLLTIR